MIDQATETEHVAAAPTRCYDIAVDFERYPEWARDVKEANVLERDSAGRATKVEYRASALGRSTHYTLAYDYSQAPERISWSLVDGDIVATCRRRRNVFCFGRLVDHAGKASSPRAAWL